MANSNSHSSSQSARMNTFSAVGLSYTGSMCSLMVRLALSSASFSFWPTFIAGASVKFLIEAGMVSDQSPADSEDKRSFFKEVQDPNAIVKHGLSAFADSFFPAVGGLGQEMARLATDTTIGAVYEAYFKPACSA